MGVHVIIFFNFLSELRAQSMATSLFRSPDSTLWSVHIFNLKHVVMYAWEAKMYVYGFRNNAFLRILCWGTCYFLFIPESCTRTPLPTPLENNCWFMFTENRMIMTNKKNFSFLDEIWGFYGSENKGCNLLGYDILSLLPWRWKE
jgi:hypothetical protein